jgi:hypothetical protein
MIFAEIVSLIAAFSTERALGRIEKNQDFLAWLTTNGVPGACPYFKL